MAATFLVTGGCGFIGAHLVRALLRRGDHVRVLDDLSTGVAEALPPGAELRVGDVRDDAAVRAALAGADGCFHLAAVASVERSRRQWRGSHGVNVGGTVAVLEAARDGASGPVPVVYASSAAVYGDAEALPLHEELAPWPISAYGVDKLASELHAAVGARLFAIPAVGLRFFNVYGPGQPAASPYSGVITRFAEQTLRDEPITIHGTGCQTRDLIYVDDVVRALLAAMARRPAGAVINVCTGRETPILEVARSLAALAGRRLRVEHAAPRQGDVQRSVGSAARLDALLGLRASTPLRSGLARTLSWHEVALAAPRHQVSMPNGSASFQANPELGPGS